MYLLNDGTWKAKMYDENTRNKWNQDLTDKRRYHIQVLRC